MLSSVSLDQGILLIQGDAGKPNKISVTMNKGKVLATAGRAKLLAAVAQILAMKIVGGTKTDIINISPLVRLAAYIDAGAGNDVIHTGAGADTVIAGAGNDKVINRGGSDAIYGGTGKNTVNALKHDSVYAGTGKSKVKGAVNQSLTNPNPVIPLPPDAKKPVVVDTTGTDSTSSQQQAPQPPSDDQQQSSTDQTTTQTPPPSNPSQTQAPVDDPVSQTDDGNTDSTNTNTPDTNPTNTDSTPQTPTDDTPQTPADNPTNTQEPGGLDNTGGNDSNQTTPPPVITYGPTLNARDFGAKLDGVTDDTAAIQAALNALPSTGGTLVLDGMAGIGSAGIHISGKDHITITASVPGAGFKSLAKIATQSIGGFSSVMVALYNCTNTTVSGLTLDGAGFANCALGLYRLSNSTIQGNDASNTGGSGAIVSVGGVGNQYLNNYVHDTITAGRGLWIGNTHDGEVEINPLISGNIVSHSSATGIATLAHGARIVNNQVTYAGGAGVVLSGVSQQTSEDAYVANNYLCFNGYHGIQADNWSSAGAYTPIGSAVIENNICNDNVHCGIYCIYATNWTIRGNTCDDNSTQGTGANSGIYITAATNIIVDGNTCSNTLPVGSRTQPLGIMVDAWMGSGSDQSIQIINNHCDNNLSNGIFLNALVNQGTTGTIDNIQIVNNTMTSNGRYGILVTQTHAGMVTNLTILDNTYTSNVSGTYVIQPGS